MWLVLATRLLLYAQIVLGTLQSPGLFNDVPGILHTHRTLAFVVPVVAFFAFRSSPSAPSSLARTVAQLGPLAVLAVGLINWVGFKMLALFPVDAYLTIMGIHMIIGIGVIVFVEITAGKDRRAMIAARSDSNSAT